MPSVKPDDWPAFDGNHNMEADAQLLRDAELGRQGLRLYRWNGPWVSLGMFQRPEKVLVPGGPVPWVMRPTGGRAVLHGHDLTLATAWPLAQLELPSRALRAVFAEVVGPIVEAFRDVGVPACFGSGQGPSQSGHDCFTHASINDVVHESTKQKICGCALRVTETAVLVQASVPVGSPLVDRTQVFQGVVADDAFVELSWAGFAAALRDRHHR